MAPTPPSKDKDKEKDKGKEKVKKLDTKPPDGIRKVKSEKLNGDEIRHKKKELTEKLSAITDEAEKQKLQEELDELNKMDLDEPGWNEGGGEELPPGGGPGDQPNLTSSSTGPGPQPAQPTSSTGQEPLGKTLVGSNDETSTNSEKPGNSTSSGNSSGAGGGAADTTMNAPAVIASSIEENDAKIVAETFQGLSLSARSGEEEEYRQISGGDSKKHKASEYAKPMGRHAHKKLLLISYGPPHARTWRLEEERTWSVEGELPLVSNSQNRLAHYEKLVFDYYKGLVGVSFEATKHFSIEKLNPERKRKEGELYPFVMLACRWDQAVEQCKIRPDRNVITDETKSTYDVVTHEIRTHWHKMAAEDPFMEIYKTARIQERAYSHWWTTVSRKVQSQVVRPLSLIDPGSIPERSARYVTRTPDPNLGPRYRYQSATPGRNFRRYDSPRQPNYSDQESFSDTEDDDMSDDSSESDEKLEAFVKKWCKKRGISFTTEILEGKGSNGKRAYKAYYS